MPWLVVVAVLLAVTIIARKAAPIAIQTLRGSGGNGDVSMGAATHRAGLVTLGAATGPAASAMELGMSRRGDRMEVTPMLLAEEE